MVFTASGVGGPSIKPPCFSKFTFSQRQTTISLSALHEGMSEGCLSLKHLSAGSSLPHPHHSKCLFTVLQSTHIGTLLGGKMSDFHCVFWSLCSLCVWEPCHGLFWVKYILVNDVEVASGKNFLILSCWVWHIANKMELLRVYS